MSSSRHTSVSRRVPDDDTASLAGTIYPESSVSSASSTRYQRRSRSGSHTHSRSSRSTSRPQASQHLIVPSSSSASSYSHRHLAVPGASSSRSIFSQAFSTRTVRPSCSSGQTTVSTSGRTAFLAYKGCAFDAELLAVYVARLYYARRLPGPSVARVLATVPDFRELAHDLQLMDDEAFDFFAGQLMGCTQSGQAVSEGRRPGTGLDRTVADADEAWDRRGGSRHSVVLVSRSHASGTSRTQTVVSARAPTVVSAYTPTIVPAAHREPTVLTVRPPNSTRAPGASSRVSNRYSAMY